MKLSWSELKRILYIFLSVSGLGMMLTSFAWLYSVDAAARLSAVVVLATGAGLLLFSFVAYLCRDDWEIWS